jgi:cell division protein FtsL
MNVFDGLGVVRSRAQRAEAHATIMHHNRAVIQELVDILRERNRTQIELEALRIELLEAETTIASLVSDLENERAHVVYLADRIAEFEDADEAARRSRPPLRIVASKQESSDT